MDIIKNMTEVINRYSSDDDMTPVQKVAIETIMTTQDISIQEMVKRAIGLEVENIDDINYVQAVDVIIHWNEDRFKGKDEGKVEFPTQVRFLCNDISYVSKEWSFYTDEDWIFACPHCEKECLMDNIFRTEFVACYDCGLLQIVGYNCASYWRGEVSKLGWNEAIKKWEKKWESIKDYTQLEIAR